MEKDLTIKILSSDKSLITTIREILKQSSRTLITESCNDILSLLSSLGPDPEEIVIIDCIHNGTDWKELLINLSNTGKKVYVIMIVRKRDSHLADEMLHSGAYDVITDNSLSILGHTISHLLPFIDDHRKLSQLSREKSFSDHIVNNSRSMITIINRDYVYEKVNRTFSMNHNTEIEKLVGCPLEAVWGKESFQNNIKKNLDTCFSGKVVYYQAFFTTPAWGKRYYEVFFRPLTDDSGNVTHALVETYDVTDLKLKEQEVSAIEWEFRNLESNLPIGFFRCDRKGRLIHVNKAFLRILEMNSEAEVLGKQISSIYLDKELCRHHLKAILSDGLASFSMVTVVSATGREVFCRISAFVVCDGSGNQIYIDGAIEDYTREVDLERRLMQAQKLDTIGLLAGGIAHDFNTILTTIYGHSEMSLEDLDTSTEAYSHVKKIVQAVGRARSLTNQILTFSRQVGQERIDVKVADIILETTGFLRPTLPTAILLIEDIRKPEVSVSADPTQLYRVFLNLINNSVQAMESSGGTITISLDSCSSERVEKISPGKSHSSEYVVISISDTGPGMESSMAERIFEPFFTARKGGMGTGLGLSVVYGIISEVEGEISVDSKKGEGTTISIYIPLVVPGNRKPVDEPKARLLVIPASDNETKVISIALANSGYAVKNTDPEGNWVKQSGEADAIVVVDNIQNATIRDIVFELENNGVNKPMLLISDFESWLKDEKGLPSDIMKGNLFKPVSLKEIISSLDTLLNKRK